MILTQVRRRMALSSKSFFALALALSLIPAVALAQDTNAPQQPADAQRQAMHQMHRQFEQSERQLHDQLRSQVLSGLTPAIGARSRQRSAISLSRRIPTSTPRPNRLTRSFRPASGSGSSKRTRRMHRRLASSTSR